MKSGSNNYKKKLCVCMISDFFFPRLGGVEVLIYQLSLSLIRRGTKVIMITRSYKNRQIIRYMGNGLKVYYLPVKTINDEIMFPSLYGLLPKIREIIITEEVDIIHMHQSTSTMGLEGVMHAKTLGINCVYTDHSLFAFDDLACVNINKVMKCFMSDIDQTISVSYIGRENLILRTMINPKITNVIPNSVDITKFTPEEKLEIQKIQTKNKFLHDELLPFLCKRINMNEEHDGQLINREYLLNKKNYINIVFLSRLTFRKGVDLLIEIIPEVCSIFPNVRFIIGGDGPKKKLLENMIKSSNLLSKVSLLGSLQHNEVRKVMILGHIYLNTSLTEAFCIANVEAASCGLYIVSTDIGGVAEVLPDEMITLVKPDKRSILQGIFKAIDKFQNENITNTRINNYDLLKNTYNCDIVARKTMKVYEKAMLNKDKSILNRFKKCMTIGKISGIFYLSLIALDYLFLMLLLVLCPKKRFNKAKNIDNDKLKVFLNRNK